jgi:hypothetical protein
MRESFIALSLKRKLAEARKLASIVVALIFLALFLNAGFTPSQATASQATAWRAARETFYCGYDPRGADEHWYNHKLNMLRGNNGQTRDPDFSAKYPAATIESLEDIAVIEDNGAIIMPPNKFDLKNKSLLFTPEGDGFRITRDNIQFTNDLGSRLTFFYNAGDQLDDFDNGYRDYRLSGPRFPFYGTSYDQVYVGTNGYITFTRGDTSARPSAAALSTDLPRIAPLWADLNLTTQGSVYFNRLDGRYVITWSDAAQSQFSGTSTFQLVLFDDGRIAFVYKKIKARSSIIGLSPGNRSQDGQPVDLSKPPADVVSGPVFEAFSKAKRLDLPALTRAFYSAHSDSFDAVYIWTDFQFDNGAGVAHSFNVRNDTRGIGLDVFDRGAIYGSSSRLATIITMGNIDKDWPGDPDANVAGLFSALKIVTHELGHRWLAYVLFDAEHDIKDDLLGRQNAHWSFLADTRTNGEGSFSSLMEGNSWKETAANTFTTQQTSANFFSELDQYLMGLRPAEEVSDINYLVVDNQTKAIIRGKSPVTGFFISATRKITSVEHIVERSGPRVPAYADAPKDFRVAFILLVERDTRPSDATVAKLDRYRDSLVRYFPPATDRRATLDGSLEGTHLDGGN